MQDNLKIVKCKICSSEASEVFQATVLKKYKVGYLKCPTCGFIQTENPHWLEEAYQASINLSDTGIVLRNRRAARIATSLILLFFNRRARFLDYAGGFGLFTRMMRDNGFDFFWSDPFTRNELARGFEATLGSRYELATSFESFEHFDDPIGETRKILEWSDNILATTELLPQEVPASNWWYYGFEHGQHISFYTREAFLSLAGQLGMNYYNVDNFHLLTKEPIPAWGNALLGLPFAKYFLYFLSFPLSMLLTSKTFTDMSTLKG